MTIRDVKIEFQQKLATLYDAKEIQSIFAIIAEEAGFSTTALILQADEPLTEEKIQYFNNCLQKLELSEPVQYVRGKTDFYDLQFTVTPAVLIPRPETEELVQLIINENANFHGNLIDLGTGSGCIAISLASNFPTAQITAMDISSAALEVAKQNAQNNNVNIKFIHADMQKDDCLQDNQQFDIIVSNPPYVCNAEKKDMRANVLQHEPHLALFVDDDNYPLQFYKAIAQFATKHLKENGTIYCEINETLGKETAELFQSYGFKNSQVIQDLFGKDRIVKAKF